MDDLFIMHYGVGHDKGGHSGRYPWGSGKANNERQYKRAIRKAEDYTTKKVMKYIQRNQRKVGAIVNNKKIGGVIFGKTNYKVNTPEQRDNVSKAVRYLYNNDREFKKDTDNLIKEIQDTYKDRYEVTKQFLQKYDRKHYQDLAYKGYTDWKHQETEDLIRQNYDRYTKNAKEWTNSKRGAMLRNWFVNMPEFWGTSYELNKAKSAARISKRYLFDKPTNAALSVISALSIASFGYWLYRQFN